MLYLQETTQYNKTYSKMTSHNNRSTHDLSHEYDQACKHQSSIKTLTKNTISNHQVFHIRGLQLPKAKFKIIDGCMLNIC